MKTLWVAFAALLALSGSMRADAVTSATGSFSGFASGFASSTPAWMGFKTQPTTTGSPFWNNPSDDAGVGGSHDMNIGYVLTDSGGLAGTSSVLGTDTVASNFLAAGGADPTAFSFVSTSLDNIMLLFADSSLNTGNAAQGTVFGYYVGNTFTPIYTPTDTASPTPAAPFDPGTLGTSYGFYATVCYAVNDCETYTTGEGNSGNVGGAAAWNHFALFQLASGNYVLGFTAADAMEGESLGDFNDVVVEIQAIPEPASIAVVGLGLAALAYFGRRATRG
jgi:hypothetical protein